MSDNWWIEKDKAYFCGAGISVLFCVDMNNLQCEAVACLPKCELVDFRVHSYSIKYKDSIICLPGKGKYIWFYDIKKNTWEKLEIEHEERLITSIVSYRQNDGRIWLIEYNSGKIFQVNLEERTVEKEYHILQNDKRIYCGEYIILQNKIYMTGVNKVFCIDIDNEDITTYNIIGLKSGLHTICHDGFNFWLSGYCKEIYIWNPEQGIVKVITKFPEQFGFYHFHKRPYIDRDSFFSDDNFFEYSILLGEHIWYIPIKSNGIIYVDKGTYEVHYLEIEEERETKESLEREYACKFLLEYIREDRYIGIYSIMNHFVFEIDTVELRVKYREYKLSSAAVLMLAEAMGQYDGRRIFNEKRKEDENLFSALLSTKCEKESKHFQSIGKLIYGAID